MALDSDEKVSILLSGPPASAKKYVLRIFEETEKFLSY
jgi:hypothetical protein